MKTEIDTNEEVKIDPNLWETPRRLVKIVKANSIISADNLGSKK